MPTVLITASHSMQEGKTIPEYNSIATWVEVRDSVYISKLDRLVCGSTCLKLKPV